MWSLQATVTRWSHWKMRCMKEIIEGFLDTESFPNGTDSIDHSPENGWCGFTPAMHANRWPTNWRGLGAGGCRCNMLSSLWLATLPLSHERTLFLRGEWRDWRLDKNKWWTIHERWWDLSELLVEGQPGHAEWSNGGGAGGEPLNDGATVKRHLRAAN